MISEWYLDIFNSTYFDVFTNFVDQKVFKKTIINNHNHDFHGQFLFVIYLMLFLCTIIFLLFNSFIHGARGCHHHHHHHHHHHYQPPPHRRVHVHAHRREHAHETFPSIRVILDRTSAALTQPL